MAAPEELNGTITLGGTAQQLLARDGNRGFFAFQNNSSEDMWLSFAGTAAIDVGIKIPSGGSCEYLVENKRDIGNPISVYGATTGSKFGVQTAQN
jgi:hypothetical protein